jgi:tetraacyldisaccharide 4'-kinase
MRWERHYHELVSGRWQGPVASLLRGALSGLEIPYAWFMRRRNARFDRCLDDVASVAAPVISVGNLTVGGTGKTPFVAWLARRLTNRGHTVTIISRGYGARCGQPNDEALELAARLPGVRHLQDRDRVRAALEALAIDPQQVLLLDDAFQHRRLARTLDIVLLDALEPFGYERLLPRGLLREPVESLARAHVVALSRSTSISVDERRAIEQRVRHVAPQAAWLEVEHRPTALVDADGQRLPLGELRGTPLAAFCGIGNPAGFRNTLAQCGFDVAAFLDFPDHCPYRSRDLVTLERWLAHAGNVEAVICTRKDFVKIPLPELAGRRLLALEIELEMVRGQAELETLLDAEVSSPAFAVSKGSFVG